MMFVGAAANSGETFLSAILRDPSFIQRCYLPFVQDFQVHESFQAKLQSAKETVMLSCSACEHITLAVKLP